MFESAELNIIGSREISVPKQKISSNPVLNGVVRQALCFLEGLLGIRSVRVTETRFQSPVVSAIEDNNTGYFRHYYPRNRGNGAVIVLPQRGRGYNAAQLFSLYLANHGFHAYELETPFRGQRFPRQVRDISELSLSAEDIKSMFNQAVREVRGLSGIVEREGYGKIGICGISLGAIYSSIAYALEPRLSSAMLVVGGGNLPEIVKSSRDGFARYLRERSLADENWADIEPCNYTNPEKAGNILMVNAAADKHVPERFGRALRDAWGNPSCFLINASHTGALMYAPEILKRASNHFNQALS